MSVEKQLKGSAESAIVLDGVPHFVQEGMEDVEERLLPEVIPVSVGPVLAELVVGLVQLVTSRPAQLQLASTAVTLRVSANSRDKQAVVRPSLT